MFYTYIIRSLKNGRFYIGATQNLEERLKQHNDNKTRSLANRGPFEIILTENYATFKEARHREIQIKKYKGGRAFKDLIKERFLGPVV